MATTADDVWRLLGELTEAQKETDRGLQATKEILQQHAEAAEQRNREAERRYQQLNEQLGKLGNRLGEFVEWQVRPAVVRLFQERGIEVHEFHGEISVQRGDEGIEMVTADSRLPLRLPALLRT
jgi:hypothetical protein